MIIAIDGPAGSGKSTVAKILAERLGFLYIDTGAMYRAITLKAIEQKINISDSDLLVKIARETAVELLEQDGVLKVYLDGCEVTKQIREPRVTRFVSDVAKIKGVREVMLKLQRGLGRKSDSVLEGRDIGTVVFPDADKKFYLDAKFDVRVDRRYKELKETSSQVKCEEVAGDLHNRDTIDSSREFAPLKKAEDAVYIDTTSLGIEEVVEAVLSYLN
ncbi:MAG: (d)CMP kinase [Candidatus Omnitrophota bacterium]